MQQWLKAPFPIYLLLFILLSLEVEGFAILVWSLPLFLFLASDPCQLFVLIVSIWTSAWTRQMTLTWVAKISILRDSLTCESCAWKILKTLESLQSQIQVNKTGGAWLLFLQHWKPYGAIIQTRWSLGGEEAGVGFFPFLIGRRKQILLDKVQTFWCFHDWGQEEEPMGVLAL